MKKFLLGVVALAITVALVPTVKAEEAAAEAMKAMAKADWINEMKAALPKEVCKPESFFASCFGGTPADCESKMAAEFSACATKHDAEMPGQFTKTEEAEQWGSKLGECTGAAFMEKNIANLSKDNEKCKDPESFEKDDSEE